MPPLATQYLRVNNLAPSETDRRTLEDSAGSGNNTATTAGFSTSTTRRWIQLVPLTANTASATPAANGKGWKIDPDTMGSVSGQRRVIPAGTWTFRLNMKASTAQLSADTKLRVFVSVVNGTAGTGTPISGLNGLDSAAVTLGLSNVEVVWTSGSIGDVILGPADTIICEFWVESVGVTIVGQTLTLTIENTSIQSRSALPADIRVIYSQAAATSGAGLASRGNHLVNLPRLSTAIGVPARQGSTVRKSALVATMVGQPAKSLYTRLSARATTLIGIAPTPPKWVRLTARNTSLVGVPVKGSSFVRLAVRSAVTAGVATAARQLDAYRSVVATLVGSPGFARAVITVRAFTAQLVGLVRGDVEIPLTALNRIQTGGPSDWPLTPPTKTIAGVIRDAQGTPYAGATVSLVRETDGFLAATQTSAADGSYSFTRGADDPYTYHVVAWEDVGTPTQGISARGLAPV